MRWLVRIGAALVIIAVLGFIGVAVLVASYSQQSDDGSADAAIVLGAAVLRTEPSPVFTERLRHAAELYKAGAVNKIVVSGGLAQGDKFSEAVAGRDWLVAQGIPTGDVLLEDQSHTTFQNLQNVKPILAANGFSRVLIVSDPLHMKRAMTIALADGIDAYPSPTPTTRFRSWNTELPMLANETWLLIGYWLLRA